jgi:hypothetical protein
MTVCLAAAALYLCAWDSGACIAFSPILAPFTEVTEYHVTEQLHVVCPGSNYNATS